MCVFRHASLGKRRYWQSVGPPVTPKQHPLCCFPVKWRGRGGSTAASVDRDCRRRTRSSGSRRHLRRRWPRSARAIFRHVIFKDPNWVRVRLDLDAVGSGVARARTGDDRVVSLPDRTSWIRTTRRKAALVAWLVRWCALSGQHHQLLQRCDVGGSGMVRRRIRFACSWRQASSIAAEAKAHGLLTLSVIEDWVDMARRRTASLRTVASKAGEHVADRCVPIRRSRRARAGVRTRREPSSARR